MNRLRETRPSRCGERWLLASAYKLAGKADVANALARTDSLQAFVFTDPNPYTFGSLLRDRAVVLMGMTLLGRDAETARCSKTSPAQLSDGSWYSTQSVAFALVAVAQNTGTKPFKGFSFDYSVSAKKQAREGGVAAGEPQTTRPAGGRRAAHAHQHLGSQAVRHGRRARRSAQRRGSRRPPMASTLSVEYSDADGKALDVRRVAAGHRPYRAAHGEEHQPAPARQPGAVAARARRAGRSAMTVSKASTRRASEARRSSRSASSGGCRPNGATTPCAPRNTWTSAMTGCSASSACKPGESIFFETRLNAAYLGQFYLPGAGVEAMYDATQHARLKGQWVEVVSPQR